MPIEAVAAAGSAKTSTTTTAPKQEMDSDMFMQLLVTQLKNQDPSSPMDTSQMVSQTTQLSMMEQLTKMSTTANESFSMSMRAAAADLIGQEVTYTNSEGKEVTGIASSVSYKDAVPQVKVGEDTVPLDLISGVKNSPTLERL